EMKELLEEYEIQSDDSMAFLADMDNEEFLAYITASKYNGWDQVKKWFKSMSSM
ncbi:hypothetical protein BGX34_003226, partial [Mortierella sp. NVP85]